MLTAYSQTAVHKLSRIMRSRASRATFAGCLLLFASACAWVTVTGLADHAAPADIIIVPGNTVHADGTLSQRLQARLDAAIALYKGRLAPKILVSGGTGAEGRDEAAAMAAYLERNGVPATAIIRDAQGVTTAATAQNAAQYLRTLNGHSALVATQFFHVARTRLALERCGIRVSGTVHAQYFEMRDIYSLMRETVGLVYYQLKLPKAGEGSTQGAH